MGEYSSAQIGVELIIKAFALQTSLMSRSFHFKNTPFQRFFFLFILSCLQTIFGSQWQTGIRQLSSSSSRHTTVVRLHKDAAIYYSYWVKIYISTYSLYLCIPERERQIQKRASYPHGLLKYTTSVAFLLLRLFT